MLEFRNVRVDEVPLVKDLFESFYGPNYCEVQNDYFLWLHRLNPDIGGTVSEDEVSAFGAFEGSELVACINYVPFAMYVEDAIVRSCWSVGWRAKEGCGAVTGLQLRKHLRKFDVYMSMGATEWVKSIYQSRFNFEYSHNIERFIAVIDVDVCSVVLDQHHTLSPSDLSSLREIHARGSDLTTGSFSEVNLEEFRSELYWRTHLERTKISCSRRYEWLKWRYADHPHLDYTMLSQDASGDGGLAVVRIDEEKNSRLKVARLLDFFPSRGGELSLVSSVLAWSAAQNVAFVDFFCGSSEFGDVLRPAFFRASEIRNLDFPRLFFPLEWRERWSINASLRDGRSAMSAMKISDIYFTKSDPSQDILLNREYVTKGL